MARSDGFLARFALSSRDLELEEAIAPGEARALWELVAAISPDLHGGYDPL